jgi:glucose/arabinose dehydrogenase
MLLTIISSRLLLYSTKENFVKKLPFILYSLLIAFIFCPTFYRATAQSEIQEPPNSIIVPGDFRIELAPVLSGLNSPVFVTNAHDGSGRLFIVEQPGTIKVLQPNASQPTVFLDISSKVLFGGERGLLGLTFHPQFRNNRRFFVNYTRQTDGATVIAEYKVSSTDANIADTSEKVILTIAQPFANHNGGMVEFGPDGYLYIGMGDGGSQNDPGNRAQNLNELLGKLLRIDVDHANGTTPYSSPADNPFFGAIAGRDEIYAYGLRNPWRFSFARNSGELIVADVGQNATEEIDQITKGGNYGWRVMEGTNCTGNDPAACGQTSFIPPIAEYNHSQGRCSITGGYIYRGTKGTFRQNHYVYADYCTGEIFVLDGTIQKLLLDTNLQITSFGEDEAGEIYVVGSGTIQRITNPNPFVNPPDPPPSTEFRIASPLIQKIASGKVINPVTARPKGKKYQIVLVAGTASDLAKNANAIILINGVELSTESQLDETGTQALLIARLKVGTLIEPGMLTIQARRADGTLSNQLMLQVFP